MVLAANDSMEEIDHRQAYHLSIYLQLWRRFRMFQKRRQQMLMQEKNKHSNRLYILSNDFDHSGQLDGEPWHVFGKHSTLSYRRWIYEISGLHYSAFHAACANGDHVQVKEWLQTNPIPVCTRARDACGRIPMHHAVISEHHRVLRALFRYSQDIRLQLHMIDSSGRTPVHYVLEKMLRLVSKQFPGCVPARLTETMRQRSERYRSLWRLADRMLSQMMLSALDDNETHDETFSLEVLDKRVRGDVWDAVHNSDAARLDRVLTLYDMSSLDTLVLHELGGRNLLHEACERSHREQQHPHCITVVRYLLSKLKSLGLSRKAVDQSGSTPIHYAASRGWIEVCVLLLEEVEEDDEMEDDLLLTTQDLRGRTPLMCSLYHACRQRKSTLSSASYATVIRWLAQRYPVSLHIADNDGHVPLHYAIDLGDADIVALFLNLGANVSGLPSSNIINVMTTAPWAPCGQVFTSKRNQKKTPQSLQKLETQEISANQSKACERLSKVRAGHVEDPGEAIPMETLWFWVRKSNKPIVEIQSIPPVLISDTAVESDEDFRRFGCRRYGGICPQCIHKIVPTDSINHSPIVLSPLVIAIRRNQFNNPSTSLVELLLYNGAIVDTSVIFEAIRIVSHPNLLSLILGYTQDGGYQLLSLSSINAFCREPYLYDSISQRAVVLKSLFTSHTIVIEPSQEYFELLHVLFRYQYFELFQWLMANATHEQQAYTWNYIRQSLRDYDMGHSHLEFLSQSVLPCLDTMLLQQVIVSKTRLETIHFNMESIDPTLIIVWLKKLLAQQIWSIAMTVIAHLITRRVRLSPHMIATSSRARIGSNDWFKVQELVHVVIIQDIGDTANWTSLDFSVACAYDIPLMHLQHMWEVSGFVIDQVVEMLSKRRIVSHRTAIEWIVEHDRVESASWLLSTLSEAKCSLTLWKAFASAIVGVSRSRDVIQWVTMLPPVNVETYDWVFVHCIIRCGAVNCLPYFLSLLATVKTEASLSQEWLESIELVYHIARWNAISIMSYLLAQYSNTIMWSSLARRAFGSITPIQLCEQLGHIDLAQMLKDLSHEEVEECSNGSHPHRCYGLLRTFLTASTRTLPSTWSRRHCRVLLFTYWCGDWKTAIKVNHVQYLDVFARHGLTPESLSSYVDLMLLAISTCAMKSLEWLLSHWDKYTRMPLHSLDMIHANRLYHAATRHTSSLYAKMTWLLLDHNLSPGRLSGDGTEMTLLHRVVCFQTSREEPNLVFQLVTRLLHIQPSDINVRDGFGLTPIAYACVAGQLETVLFLISLYQPQLEDEFEGQSSFYYVLHLLPSYGWRLLVRALLMQPTHHHSFLHCQDPVGCACKGYEVSVDSQGLCGFCDHPIAMHSRIPFPSWFYDQYETYLIPNKDNRIEDEEGETKTIEIEEVVEQKRGRLSTFDIYVITRIRFKHLMDKYALDVCMDEPTSCEESLRLGISESLANDVQPERNDHETTLLPLSTPIDGVLPMAVISRDICLLDEGKMIHPPDCPCLLLVTRSADQIYRVLSQWLYARIYTKLTVQQAFDHWCRQKPASLPVCPPEEIRMVTTITSRPKTSQQSAVSILQLFLFHWRYARVYQCFRQWQRWSSNAQVVLHELESLADEWNAEARSLRYQELRKRQQALEMELTNTQLD